MSRNKMLKNFTILKAQGRIHDFSWDEEKKRFSVWVSSTDTKPVVLPTFDAAEKGKK